MDSVEILIMFRTNNVKIENARVCVLFFLFIGVERFKISKSKYAEAPMQAEMI